MRGDLFGLAPLSPLSAALHLLFFPSRQHGGRGADHARAPRGRLAAPLPITCVEVMSHGLHVASRDRREVNAIAAIVFNLIFKYIITI